MKSTPKYQFVNDTYGYISLFPIFLELVPADHEILGISLEKLRSIPKGGIWTKFGLRSISNKSPYYNARNTEHDPAYWRGPIWVNINILTVRALKHYSFIDGPYQSKCLELYKELKENIYNTVYNEWKRTGFIWEQYDDMTGKVRGRELSLDGCLVILLD